MKRTAAPVVTLSNRQRKVALDVRRLRRLATRAVPPCLAHPGLADPALPNLDEVGIVLVSDPAISRVHDQFMDVADATDVITFAHGEIIVSAETAAREAREHSEPLERETLRYIVHGLLHLNGHEDTEAEEAAAMWKAQESVVELLWPVND